MPVVIPNNIHRVYSLYFLIEHIFGQKMAEFILKNKKRACEKKLQNINIKSENKILKIDQGNIELTEFQNNYLNSNKPYIFKNLATSWSCNNIWSLDFFAKSYGDYQVNLYQARKGLARENKPDESLKLGDFITAIKSGDKRYLNFSPLLTKFPELQEHLNHDWLNQFRSDNKNKAEYTLFMGGKDTLTPVHCEPTGNFFIQVHGRKKWILYPAKTWPILKPPAARKFYFHSSINPEKVDRHKFPMADKLDRYECILEPGDILWNPPFMWHQVENLELSIGVSYKIDNFLRSCKSSPLLMALSLMATNPTVFTLFLKTYLKRDHVFFPD